jgi:hypothetical protein
MYGGPPAPAGRQMLTSGNGMAILKPCGWWPISIMPFNSFKYNGLRFQNNLQQESE